MTHASIYLLHGNVMCAYLGWRDECVCVSMCAVGGSEGVAAEAAEREMSSLCLATSKSITKLLLTAHDKQ